VSGLVAQIIELLLSILDVLEAEVRSLRVGVARMVSALLIFAVAGLMLLFALLIVLWAMYLWLETLLLPPAAALLVSLGGLLLSSGLWWWARRMLR
jgi:uncharacterized membrane protein YqgA involved in biofilm formation